MNLITLCHRIFSGCAATLLLNGCADQERLSSTAPSPDMGSMAFSWESLAAKATAIGASRFVCRAPTATLDELEMHVTSLNSKGAMPHPPHHHPNEEILIIKEGSVEALVNGQWTNPLGPGSIIFQASNIEHAIRNAGDGPATYIVISWKSAKAGGAGPAPAP